MRHVLIFLRSIVGFKLVALLLTVGMGVILFQLSGAYKEQALNVHTEIKAYPPGIVKIIDQTGQPSPVDSDTGSSGENQPTETEPTSQSGTESAMQPGTETTPPGDNTQTQKPSLSPFIDEIIGGGGAPPPSLVNLESNRPTVLTINTDIDFGTVFPGEECEGHFIVYLTGTDNSSGTDQWPGDWPTPFISANYTLLLVSKNGYGDMRPTMVVERDTSETDTEPDPIANGWIVDYQAMGSLDKNADPSDTGDKWIVSWNATDTIDEFWTEIRIVLIDYEAEE